jgi:hypothetical protein
MAKDLRLLTAQFYILNSQFSIAVCIIPNIIGMFNIFPTFLRKKLERGARGQVSGISGEGNKDVWIPA